MKKNMKRSRRMVNVISGLFVMCLVCTGAAYDVTGLDIAITEIDEIHDVENTITVKTRANKVSDVLAENNKELGMYDTVNLNDYHALENGDRIIIRRGTGITVETDGTIVTTSTTANTVGEALVENGIFIGELDYTVPKVDEEITENVVIKIVRVESVDEIKEETVPYDTVFKNDSGLSVGKTKVIKKGTDGKVRITERVVKENGVEISRSEVSREVVTEKVDRVVAKGTKKSTGAKTVSAPSKSDAGFSYSKKMTMTATAYSAFKKDGSYGRTASGMIARYGIVAVDPKVIPLGTNLYVEGYGYAVAGDTGGVIKGNKIDLCFEKPNKELMVFGRKQLTVYILD